MGQAIQVSLLSHGISVGLESDMFYTDHIIKGGYGFFGMNVK